MATTTLPRLAHSENPAAATLMASADRPPAECRSAAGASPFTAVAPARGSLASLIPVRWTDDGALLLV